jgi:ribosomal-protein-alanine N-acetyltransferase
MTQLVHDNLKLREFKDSDKTRLAELCNNRKIWDNVRDLMPFPYLEKDAENFIGLCRNESPQTTFAIEYNGEIAGCIGIAKQTDVYKLSGELGYWIGEPYWRKGIATKAVNMIVDYGFSHLGLVRIYSGVFDFNKASQRVLEKTGFKLESICEKAVYKNGLICDEYKYGKVKDEQ